jgi:hypothetical protein
MNKNIVIPKKIDVGFKYNEDTYTKKLAYITYYDNKDKLQRESNWNSLRDKRIDNIIFDNTPTKGFILNKQENYSSDWYYTQCNLRVYDPRGFEFKITTENLLYILENTNSSKGKKLEGEFVYSWCGADLILMPVTSPDYQEIAKYCLYLYVAPIIKSLALNFLFSNNTSVYFDIS